MSNPLVCARSPMKGPLVRQQVKGVVIASLVFILAGCQRQAASRVYDVKGTVVAVDPAAKTLELDHEEIPGYMQAMRMTYPVADAKLLEGLSAGDSVLGKLKVGSRSYTLTSLAKR
jgi:protein SCO1/2